MRFVLPLFVVAGLALAGDAAAFPQSDSPAMTDPSKATEKAPETFSAKFETTKGELVVDCIRAWAPNGVDRFYNLVKIGFFDDIALFRVSPGFVVQWGIHGDPTVSKAWRSANIQPDPVKESNKRGTLTYAMSGSPDTRSTQLFINFADNASLDAQGFAPICKVSSGMQVVDQFYSEYGERITNMQGEIQMKGNAYLKASWPNLDYIKAATIVGEPVAHGKKGEGDAAPDPKSEEGGSLLPYVLGLFVVGAVVVFLLNRNKEDDKKPAPAPTKKPSTDGKSSTPGKKKKRPKP